MQQKYSVSNLPKHIAIIPDGNNRWAKKRYLPSIAGHNEGLKVLKDIIQTSLEMGISYITVFGFSSENWSRPKGEIFGLMKLFLRSLRSEVKQLIENEICLRIIGDISKLDKCIQKEIHEAHQATSDNHKLTLIIAINYGGIWDITQASKKIATLVKNKIISIQDISEEKLKCCLSTKNIPDPDLMIRTSGEQRISNFLLWQLAYTELFFSAKLWPDFKVSDYKSAILDFCNRERRFGYTSEQIEVSK